MFAKQLRQLRMSRGLTIQQVAAEIGITAQSLSRIELGTRLPSKTTLEALARALDTTFVIDPGGTRVELAQPVETWPDTIKRAVGVWDNKLDSLDRKLTNLQERITDLTGEPT